MKAAFHIRATKSRRLYLCQARIDEENSGFFGFHSSDKCPDCRYEDHGWELWGENGHLQGWVKPDQNLDEMLAHRKKLDPSLEFTVDNVSVITWYR